MRAISSAIGAAEAIGLDEVDGGQEAGLTEGVGPGIRALRSELVESSGQGKFLKSGGGFGEEDDVQRIVGPVRERDFDWSEAELLGRFQGSAIDLGGGRLVHPGREVAKAETADGGGGVEVEVTRDAGDVSGIWAGDGVEHEQSVFDRARHGAEFVERPAERHGASSRDAAISWTKAGDAAAHGRAHDAAFGFTADGECDEPRRSCRAWASGGTGRAFFEQPGIHGLTAEPDVIEGERAEREFGDENRARGMQALRDGGVFGGNAIAERFGPIGGANASGVEQVFCTPWDAVERTTVVSGGNLLVGLAGLREREFAGESDDAVELGIEALQAVEINIGEASEVSLRCSIHRERRVTGEKAMAASEEGSGPGSTLLRTKRFCEGPEGCPGNTGFHCDQGAMEGSMATLRGPTRRS